MRIIPKDSADYKITQSYLMHFYIDTGKKEKYLAESAGYFSGEKNETSLSKQLEYILKEGVGENPLINIKYALYVFVRGLYSFRLKELSNSLWDKLKRIDKEIAKKRKKKIGK